MPVQEISTQPIHEITIQPIQIFQMQDKSESSSDPSGCTVTRDCYALPFTETFYCDLDKALIESQLLGSRKAKKAFERELKKAEQIFEREKPDPKDKDKSERVVLTASPDELKGKNVKIMWVDGDWLRTIYAETLEDLWAFERSERNPRKFK